VNKRTLGKSGLEIAPLVFGGNVFGWTSDEATSFRILDAFIARGFNCIDTADMYSVWVPGHSGGESETILGKWMKQRGNRDKVIVLTKVGMEMGPGKKGLKKDYILRAAEDSLQRLQTDYIDLYQSHQDDPDTPVDETLEAYSQLVKAGKVRAIGASNFGAQRLDASLKASAVHGLPRYESLQPLYNLMERAELGAAVSAGGPGRDHLLLARGRFSHRQVPLGRGPGQEPAWRLAEEVPQRTRPARAACPRRGGGTARLDACGGGACLVARTSQRHRADRERQQPGTARDYVQGG